MPQSASIAEIKKELQTLHGAELIAVCLRLAKYKKDNKELLNYILFESGNESLFIEKVKEEMNQLFTEVNTTTLYFAKKTIRKILRFTNKYANYSGKATTQIELLIHFCQGVKALKLDFSKSTAMQNLYEAQLKKIDKALLELHEDLQYDYQKEIDQL